MPIEKELTTHEVAQQLCFSDTAILVWVKKGFLVARVTPGGHRRFRQCDVDSFKEKMNSGAFKFSDLPVEKKMKKLLKKGMKKKTQASK